MKKYIHWLIIDTDEDIHDKITEILRVDPMSSKHINPARTWIYETVKYGPPQADFINEFMDILEPRLSELLSIGVTPSSISIKLAYEYEPDFFNMCNMEFVAADLARMGRAGIDFCITCWISDDYENENDKAETRGMPIDLSKAKPRLTRVRRLE